MLTVEHSDSGILFDHQSFCILASLSLCFHLVDILSHGRGGPKRWTFSETADISGQVKKVRQSADNRNFNLCITVTIRCVYRAELILGRSIVYLSYKDPCPTISIPHARDGQHGQRWNLREFTASYKLFPLGRASGVARGARGARAGGRAGGRADGWAGE